MNPILLRTTLATLIAFAGGALGVALGQSVARRLTLLIYIAMAALLGVTVCDVLPDAKSVLSWPAFLAAVASGAALFWLVSRYIYHVCPACSFSPTASISPLGIRTTLLMVALAIHSTLDGLAVGVGDELAGRPDWAVLLAVAIHKLPEGLALALLLIGSGYTPRKALLWTCAVESTTEIGGLLGITALRDAPRVGLGLLFGHVGGGFLYLVGSTIRTAVRQNEKALVAQQGAPSEKAC